MFDDHSWRVILSEFKGGLKGLRDSAERGDIDEVRANVAECCESFEQMEGRMLSALEAPDAEA